MVSFPVQFSKIFINEILQKLKSHLSWDTRYKCCWELCPYTREDQRYRIPGIFLVIFFSEVGLLMTNINSRDNFGIIKWPLFIHFHNSWCCYANITKPAFPYPCRFLFLWKSWIASSMSNSYWNYRTHTSNESYFQAEENGTGVWLKMENFILYQLKLKV